MKKTNIVAASLIMLVGVQSSLSFGMESLSDEGLAGVAGQSLFTTNYVAPGGTNPNPNVGFYRLGVEAKMEINANIDKLRLGCDGANGTGVCDVSIDRLRLTGLAGTHASDSGPPTDFLLNQPFFEFAIKNPTNAATREVVGIRFGALESLGAMTMGENTNLTSLADDTGINTISGSMTANVINATMTNVCATLFGLCTLYGSATVANFSQLITLNRATTIADLGPMTAVASSSLLGLTLTDTHIVNLPLKTIHRIEVRNPDGTPTKDFFLSTQSQAINWQKSSDGSFTGVSAQSGWWMSLPQVVMPNITSDSLVKVGAVGAVFNARVNIPGIDLGQRPVDNCWGASPFC